MTALNLVVQTAFLGDLILTIPVLNKIKQLYPNIELAIVCKKGLGQFLLDEKIVDKVFEIEKSNANSYRQIVKVLSDYQIKNIYCIHRSTRSLLFVDSLKAERKVGFSSWLGFWVFDETVEFVAENPEVIRQYAVLKNESSEIKNNLSDDYSFLNNISSTSYKTQAIPDFFAFPAKSQQQTNSKTVAIFPGSVWATKKWPQAYFVELIKSLQKDGYQVDLFGGAAENELCQQIASQLIKPVGNYAGKYSITESIRSLKNYALVVSNDSASTHMAAYIGTPVVSIFGPTTSKMGFRPWSNNSFLVENIEMACRPCGPHGHQHCPLGHHNCMNSLTANIIYKVIKTNLY